MKKGGLYSEISKEIKCIFVGDGSVGKTCILTRHCNGKFSDAYVPTVFENHVEVQSFNGQQICLNLWDTAGQEDYDRLRPLSYASADVIVLCFDMLNLKSLENAETKWKPELDYWCKSARVLHLLFFFLYDSFKNLTTIHLTSQIVLVGTKLDLLKQKEEKLALTILAEKTKKKIHARELVLCSSKTNEGIEKIFEEIMKTGLKKKKARCTIL